MNKLLIDLCREWLDGTAKPVACGYGPDGPNIQVDLANGDTAVICLRSVAEALVNSYKESDNNDLVRENERFRAILKEISTGEELMKKFPPMDSLMYFIFIAHQALSNKESDDAK